MHFMFNSSSFSEDIQGTPLTTAPKVEPVSRQLIELHGTEINNLKL